MSRPSIVFAVFVLAACKDGAHDCPPSPTTSATNATIVTAPQVSPIQIRTENVCDRIVEQRSPRGADIGHVEIHVLLDVVVGTDSVPTLLDVFCWSDGSCEGAVMRLGNLAANKPIAANDLRSIGILKPRLIARSADRLTIKSPDERVVIDVDRVGRTLRYADEIMGGSQGLAHGIATCP